MFEPGDLRCAVGGDDDDGIHALMGAGFKQERHFVHDDGMRSAFGDTANETLLLSRYPRMDDVLELPKLSSVMEDDRPERMAVDGPVLVQHTVAEQPSRSRAKPVCPAARRLGRVDRHQ